MAWFLFCAKLDYFIWFQKYTISAPKHGFSTPKKILTSEPKAFFSFHQTFYPKRINFSSPHDSSLSLKRIPLPTPKVIAFLLTKKNYSFLIQNMFPFLPQTWLLLHPKKNPTPFCKMFSFLHVWKRNSLSPPKYDPISTKIWSFLLTKMNTSSSQKCLLSFPLEKLFLSPLKYGSFSTSNRILSSSRKRFLSIRIQKLFLFSS